jgi:hypothetical protein
MRKPCDSASAESCVAAVLRARWTPTLTVIALGAQGGSGGDVVSVAGADAADDAADGEVAGDGAGGLDPPAHGCGVLSHVGGNNEDAFNAVPAVAVWWAAGVAVTTVASTAVLGAGCPGNSQPSPSRKITSAPFNSPWAMQVNLGTLALDAAVPVTVAVQLPGRLPPALCMTVVSAVRVVATLVVSVKQRSETFPHAVNDESRTRPAGSCSPVWSVF